MNQQGSAIFAKAPCRLHGAADQDLSYPACGLNAHKCLRVGDPICAKCKPILRGLLVAYAAAGCDYTHLRTPGLRIQVCKKQPCIRADLDLAQYGKIAGANTVIGGWTISNVDRYFSGTLLWVKEANWSSGIFAGEATASNLGDSLNARPNVVPGVSLTGFHGGGWVFGQSRKFNPAAFTQAPSYTFGDAPRLLGNVRNFANRDEDIAASKKFPLGTERVNLLFRFDAFDVFNRHTWTGFDNTLGDANFGESTSTSGNRTMQGNFRIVF